MPGLVIIVGLDHTPRGAGALRYAMRRAAAVGGRVRLVRVIRPLGTADQHLEQDAAGARRDATDRTLDWVYGIVESIENAPPIEVVNLDGEPAVVLASESAGASALVVGAPSEPLEGLSDPLLTSLRAHARCLLIEVTDEGEAVRASGPTGATPEAEDQHVAQTAPAASGPVLIVGLDGSSGSLAALGWAVDHAAKLGGNVQVVTAIRSNADGAEQRALDLQETALASLSASQLRPTSKKVVPGEPVDVMARASEQAQMLVLGRHGVSGMVHSALGSVGDACARLAYCPVTIVPAPVGDLG